MSIFYTYCLSYVDFYGMLINNDGKPIVLAPFFNPPKEFVFLFQITNYYYNFMMLNKNTITSK